jgi:hypothetical protein
VAFREDARRAARVRMVAVAAAATIAVIVGAIWRLELTMDKFNK